MTMEFVGSVWFSVDSLFTLFLCCKVDILKLTKLARNNKYNAMKKYLRLECPLNMMKQNEPKAIVHSRAWCYYSYTK